MPTLQLMRQEQILARMVSRVVARTSLTDLNDSSVVMHILAATAREIDNVYFQFTNLMDLFDIDKASGADLDARAREIQPGLIRRAGGRRAIGRLVFSRASDTGTTLSVPAGTLVRSSSGQTYTTTDVAVITTTSPEQVDGHGLGRDSNVVTAVAAVAGVAGNTSTGTVTGFQSKPVGVSEVTNVTAFTLGSDAESDDVFRARIKQYVGSLARATSQALEFAVLGVEDSTGKRVVYSRVVEDPTERGHVILYVDDGAGTAAETDAYTDLAILDPAIGGEEYIQLPNTAINFPEGAVTVALERSPAAAVDLTQGVDWYLNPASGLLYVPAPSYGGIQAGDVITASYEYFTGLIPEVQKVVDGDRSDRQNYPGHRAAGVLVRVRAPEVTAVSVQATVETLPGYDHDLIAADAVNEVIAYVNALGIGASVIAAEIIERIMSLDGVYDVTLVAPTANILVANNQIARTSAANVVVT